MSEGLFEEFSKIARLNRGIVVTEKIDGTNAQVHILAPGEPLEGLDESYILARSETDGVMLAGSRSRYIVPAADNAGFATWVKANAANLWALGPGRHFGEWWGAGIQRRYGLGATNERRWSLFNTARWGQDPGSMCQPVGCYVVPVLYRGPFSEQAIKDCLERLRTEGSVAAPGFKDPEGVVVWHEAARTLFKVTLKNDEQPKSKASE